MTLTAENVKVGVTGGIFGAPAGTTLPTSSSESLNAAFVEVGYLSDDGVVQSMGASTTKIKAWQNSANVRTIQTEFDLTYKFTMIESNGTVMAAYYGNYTAGTVEISSDLGDRGPWVLNVVDGDDKIRIVIPDGDITERGDVVYKSDSAIAYPVTITAYPDTSGNNAYLYLTDTDLGVSA